MKTAFLFLLASALLMSTTARSQSVVPDSGFATNGILTIPVNSDRIYFKRPLGQGGDKILVPFTSDNYMAFQSQAIIVRSTAEGTLDAGFGNKGYRYFGLRPSVIIAAAVQPDDRILVLYSEYNQFTDFITLSLVRTLPDGSTDSSFNGTGIVSLSGEFGFITAGFFALKPDGHIIVSHSKGGQQYYTQLNRNARVDKSFGTSGSIVSHSVYNQQPVGLITLPDNRIVIANEYPSGSASADNLYVYTAGGQPDATVGNNGVVLIGNQAISPRMNVDLKSYNHKLYVYAGDGLQDVLIRYNENGTPDLSFGTNGKVYSITPNSTANRELDIQPNGKIIALITGSGGYRRYNTNGFVDSTFGVNGTFTPAPKSAGVDFRIINGRGFIASLQYNSGFKADAYLSAFKLTPAASSSKISLTAAGHIQVRASVGVYPNPVHDVLYITGLTSNIQHQLLLTSQDGKRIFNVSTRSASYQLTMGALAKGIYYLSVMDGGSRSTVFKIEKQ